MISQELNERLTQTGPGTPMGDLLRRYWHPVGGMAELEKEPVQPVRLMGESLTLFRSAKRAGPYRRPVRIVYNGRLRKPDQPPRESIPFHRESLEYDELGRVWGTNIVRQDEMAWVRQGSISDRTMEHLVTSDKGVMLFHNLLLQEAEKVERGEEPLGVIRDPAINEPYIHIGRGSRYGAFRSGVQDEIYG